MDLLAFLMGAKISAAKLPLAYSERKADHPHGDYICQFERLYSNITFTEVDTGTSRHFNLNIKFKAGIVWCILPYQRVCFNGGEHNRENSMTILDCLRERSFYTKTYIHSMRRFYALAYLDKHIYAVGGYEGTNCTDKCERFELANDNWASISPLPIAASNVSLVAMKESLRLYALGGLSLGPLNTIQVLDLASLTWTVLATTLPYKSFNIPSFQVNASQLCFVQKNALLVFSPDSLAINLVKKFNFSLSNYSGPCYFKRGTLYYSHDSGTLQQEIGDDLIAMSQ